MSIYDCSAFDVPRPFSTNTAGPPQLRDETYDLLTFLAVAQALKIAILPTTWQSARPKIGSGGTSQINQALINVHTSLAFKRVSLRQKRREAEDLIFRVLVSEVAVLRHPQVRAHPNILDLQGICWDIPAEPDSSSKGERTNFAPADKIWPVLVFEKSQYGDMYHFARLPVGRSLSSRDRVRICVAIGTAISDMHLCRIVHGDIKPQNVLIFKDKNTTFAAKVTDFGYSTCYDCDDCLIQLPKSEPWHAPEYDSSGILPAQALRMDIFSLALLFLWFIFERQFSGIQPFPDEADWAKRIPLDDSDETLCIFIEKAKKDKTLIQLASQLVSNDQCLSFDEKSGLCEFFEMSLESDLDLRAATLERSLRPFGRERSSRVAITLTNDTASLAECEFKISASLVSLYKCDYRVRSYITVCLEHRVASSPTNHYLIQLALCYEIGFGCAKDSRKADWIARRTRHRVDGLDYDLVDDVENHSEEIEEAISNAETGSLFRTLQDDEDALPGISCAYYLEQNCLETATLAIKHEVAALEQVFGRWNHLVLEHELTLASVMADQGNWSEAEKLCLALMKKDGQQFGRDHLQDEVDTDQLHGPVSRYDAWLGADTPATERSMNNLALVYMRLNKLAEAENLLIELQKRSHQIRDGNRSSTLVNTSNLAMVYFHQARFVEAARLQLQVIEGSQNALGERNRIALTAMTRLADTYMAQERWIMAEKLQFQVVAYSQQIYGDDHLTTLESMRHLVTTYSCQRQWTEAEDLQVEVVNKMSETLGEAHPNTLNSLKELANILVHEGKHEAARELKDRAVLVQPKKQQRLKTQDDESLKTPYPRSIITRVLDYDRSSFEMPIEKPTHFSPYD